MPSAKNSTRSFLNGLSPIYEPQRQLKVICIGAGASGLMVAYKMQRNFDDFSLTVYEKNPDTSGTWFENRYPGCACDIPAHCYTWSFEPNPNWSATYATSIEIHEYFKDFAAKYELNKYIKLQHRVSGATWDQSKGRWHVEIEDLATNTVIQDQCHVLINAGGVLNAWRFPPIPGIDKYKGPLLHSAAWDPNVQLEGKTVGLIGNGSSGIQILPAVKNQASNLVTFIREPTWISPLFGQDYEVYSDETKQQFASNPELLLQLRKKIEAGMNAQFGLFYSGSDAQEKSRHHMLEQMKQKLNHPQLEKLLIPDWSVGCRRITPGLNYLESLTDPKVDVVYGEISQVTEKGCVVDGKEYHTDVLICATGFDTTFKPRFPLIGKTGEKLSDVWSEEPRGYFGIAASNYPNYFMVLGPNCPVGNGPVLVAIEAEVDYMIKMLGKFQKENIKSFDIKPDAVNEFNEWKDQFMEGTIWTEECRSWYKAGSMHGRVAALWPGSTIHHIEALEEPRWEDWTFEYSSRCRYEYLGNGKSSAEGRRSRHLAYYIRNQDDSPVDPILKKGEEVISEISLMGH